MTVYIIDGERVHSDLHSTKSALSYRQTSVKKIDTRLVAWTIQSAQIKLQPVHSDLYFANTRASNALQRQSRMTALVQCDSQVQKAPSTTTPSCTAGANYLVVFALVLFALLRCRSSAFFLLVYDKSRP
jgi:hypothetical protein